MRFLHTSDWHLGRTFHGWSLLDQQATFLEWLVEVADQAAVDAVLVSGDLYDRSLPPAEAVELASSALERLAASGRHVVVISGNHDSATRLGFASPLLARAGLHLRTRVDTCADPVVIDGARVYGVPYLEPDAVRSELGCEERTHDAVTRAALARVAADAAAIPGPTIVLAHAFVAGGAASESERELIVGGSGHVALDAFKGIGYVALGHLHRPQVLGANARYAGSPIAYSFSEAGDTKSVVLGEVSSGGEIALASASCPVPRPLMRLRGTLDQLLMDPRHAVHEEAWLEATITDPVRPVDAMPRLQRRFPHAASISFDPQGERPGSTDSYAERLRGLSDDEIAARFVMDVRGIAASDDELGLLREALHAGRAEESVI